MPLARDMLRRAHAVRICGHGRAAWARRNERRATIEAQWPPLPTLPATRCVNFSGTGATLIGAKDLRGEPGTRRDKRSLGLGARAVLSAAAEVIQHEQTDRRG